MTSSWEVQAILADHYANPRNWGILHRARSASRTSPGCGDEQVIYVEELDGRAARISFQAGGCALSRACTSLLLEHAEGLLWEEVAALDQSFFTGLLGTDIVQSRPKCALLGLAILRDIATSGEDSETSPSNH